jgi:hypothetical protein
MNNQIQELLAQVAIAGSVLPSLLLFLPKNWSDNMKKGATFLLCLLLTVFISLQKHDFQLSSVDFGRLVIILVVANQMYDKVMKPVTETLAAKTPLKFLNRSNKSV